MAWFQKKTETEGARPRAAGAAIHELLNEKAIVFPPAGVDKPGLLELLAQAACAAHGLGDHQPFLARVREREEGISTTLDTGLSLPHARIDGLAQIVAGLAILPAGVPDPKQPDLKIRAMFMFFSPNRQDAFTLHLQLLRAVSTLFQPPLIEDLVKLKTPADVLERLRAAQR